MGIRFIGRYVPEGRIRVTALTIIPAFTVQPAIAPNGGAMGATFTGDDGKVRGATVTKREWLFNGVPIQGQTTNSYVSDGSGVLTYRVTATGRGGTVVATSAPVTVTVNPAKLNAPTWRYAPGLLGTFAEGSSVNIPILADDKDNNIATYGISSGQLPNGLSIDMFSGVISGTLGEVSADTSYTFEVMVTDRTNLSVKGKFTINVSNVKSTVTWQTSNAQPVAETSPGQPVNINLGASSN